jgi:hypothetical protein
LALAITTLSRSHLQFPAQGLSLRIGINDDFVRLFEDEDFSVTRVRETLVEIAQSMNVSHMTIARIANDAS